MTDGILFERPLVHGPVVRIRRTSPEGELPVTAVLEVDRRAGTPRANVGGYPPPLLAAEGGSDDAVRDALEPTARDDAEIARLMRERGQR
jgi:hypothetical protein